MSCRSPIQSNKNTIRAYRHIGMNNIMVDNRRVQIHFSSNSNKEEIQLLGGLNPLIPTDRIVYIGILHNEWKTVPQTDSEGNFLLEGREQFKYFDLIHWYVMCPFKYNIAAEKNVDGYEFITRKALKESDFGYHEFMSINIQDYMIDVDV